MHKYPKTIAIIPARGGSKRLNQARLASYGGIPLNLEGTTPPHPPKFTVAPLASPPPATSSIRAANGLDAGQRVRRSRQLGRRVAVHWHTSCPRASIRLPDRRRCGPGLGYHLGRLALPLTVAFIVSPDSGRNPHLLL